MIEKQAFSTRVLNALRIPRLTKDWARFWVNYFTRPAEPAVYRLRNGLTVKMRTGTADFRILREILVAHDYETEDFAIRPSDVIVDIGGQIGLFTLMAARRARQGRVFTFEPNPDNYRLLQDNLALNGFDHATAIPRAVAGTAGTRTFYLSPTNTGGHSLLPDAAAQGSLTVETVTLEGFMADRRLDRVDGLKMDCEGAEQEILASLSPDGLRRIGRMAIETHAGSMQPVLEFFRDRGWRTRVKDTLVFAQPS